MPLSTKLNYKLNLMFLSPLSAYGCGLNFVKSSNSVKIQKSKGINDYFIRNIAKLLTEERYKMFKLKQFLKYDHFDNYIFYPLKLLFKTKPNYFIFAVFWI